MSDDIQDGTRTLHLPAILDLTRAADLKRELEAAVAAGGEVIVDASDVQRLCSLCLQLLVAARRCAALRIRASSQTFDDMAHGLGLSQALGLTQPDMAGEDHG